MAWVGGSRLDGVDLNFAAKALIRSNSEGGLCAPAGFYGVNSNKAAGVGPQKLHKLKGMIDIYPNQKCRAPRRVRWVRCSP